MGIIGNIFNSFRGQAGQAEPAYQEKLFLVDANGLYEGRKGQKLAPRDQIDILQKLSHISSNEGIAIHAFLEGESLRKVEHGGKFDDVTVYFVAEAKDLPDSIINHLKDWVRRKDVTVITSDRRLEERVLVDGAETMRISTFKKAFEKTMGARKRRRAQRRGGSGEGEGGGEGGGGGGGGGGESRGRGEGRGRGRGEGRRRQGNRRPPEKRNDDGNDDGNGQDGVNALIDLLD